MNTAPVNTVINDQGALSRDVVVNGVTLTAGMTAEQRFAAIAKANVSTQFHTDSTAALFAQKDGPAPGSIGGKAPPPSPKALEAANKPGAVAPQGTPSAARFAEFEEEMQAKGLMVRPDGSTHADGAADPAIIEKLTARYRSLHKGLIADQEPGKRKTEKEAELRAAYERDLKRAVEGRPLSEFELRLELSKPKAAPATPPAAPGWKAHVENGEWVGLEHLTLNDTHGFTIPRYVDNQRVHVSTFDMLRDAQAAGITQAQVNAVLRQHAVRAGWVKS